MSATQQKFEEFSDYKKPRLVASAAYKWAAMIVSIVVVFFLTPYVIDTLGKYGYGIWTILTSLVGYYGLFNMGITSAVSRFVSVNIGKKDLSALNVTFNSAFFLFIGMGVVAVVASQLLAGLLARLFGVADVDTFVHLIKLMGIAVGLGFPTSVLISVLISHEFYNAQSVVSIASTLIKSAFTVYFLQAGIGIEGLAYSFIITAGLELVVFSALVLRSCPWVSLSLGDFKPAMIKTMLIFGLPTLVMTVSSLLRTNLDSLVIGSMVGIEEVAIYSVAALLIRYIFSFANSGLGVFSSRFARLIGANKDVRGLFFSSLYFGSLVAFAAGGAIYLFGGQFIYLWLGEGFDDALPVLWILMFCYIVAISQIPGYTLLMALNKHKIFAAITFGEGVANLILSVLLAPHYGILGVALGTAIPMLVIKLLLQPYFVARAAKVSIASYLAPFLLPVACGSALFALGWVFSIAESLTSYGWLGLIAGAGSYGLIFLAACLFVTKAFRPTLLQLNV